MGEAAFAPEPVGDEDVRGNLGAPRDKAVVAVPDDHALDDVGILGIAEVPGILAVNERAVEGAEAARAGATVTGDGR